MRFATHDRPADRRSWIGLPAAVPVSLAAVTISLLVIRLALSSNRTGPLVIADEIGYLINARVLAGGTPGILIGANVYSGGYSFILTPCFALLSDPTAIYHAVMVTNAVLGATVLPLLYGLIRRVVHLPPWPALGAATLGAIYPPGVLYGEFALSENLLIPLFCAWLLTLMLALERGRGTRSRLVWLILASVLAGWLFWTHERMLPVVGVHIFVLVACTLTRHVPPRTAVVGAVASLGATAGAYLANAHLYAVNWPGKVLDQRGRGFGNLTDRVRFQHFSQFVDGELAYLFVASLGLAAVGVIALAASLTGPVHQTRRDRWAYVRSRGDGEGVPDDHVLTVVAIAVLATLAGVLFLTGLASGDLTRPDHYVYGRYVEVMAPVLVAFGLAACAQWWPVKVGRGVVFAGAIALTTTPVLVAVWKAGPALDARNIGWVNVLGLRPLGGGVIVNPERACVFGLVVLAVFMTLALSRWTFPLGMAGLLVLSLLSARSIDRNFLDSEQTRAYPSDAIADELAAIPEDDHVAYDTSSASEAEFRFQYFLDDITVELFDSRTQQPPADADIVFARPDWSQASNLGAADTWHDGVSGMDLWRLPAR